MKMLESNLEGGIEQSPRQMQRELNGTLDVTGNGEISVRNLKRETEGRVPESQDNECK